MVLAEEKMGGRFDLDADQAGAGVRIEARGIVFRAIEDDVVAFAVAVGAGNDEALAGGGEGEG